MKNNGIANFLRPLAGGLVLTGIALLLVAGCSGRQPDFPNSVEVPSGKNSPADATPPTSSPSTDSGGADQNGSYPRPATETPGLPSKPVPVVLKILAPADGLLLEVGFVRVMGITSATSAFVHGTTALVDDDGFFQLDIALEPGENLIEVVASDGIGLTASHSVKVTVAEPGDGVPFTVLFPPDGYDSDSRSIAVVGVTTPDAAVAVNGTPADVNGVGIFSASVDLETGGNFLEITGADIQGNTQFREVTVFFSD